MKPAVLPGSGESSQRQSPPRKGPTPPSVDRLLSDPRLESLIAQAGRALAKRAIQQALAQLRKEGAGSGLVSEDALIGRICAIASYEGRPRLKNVINLTGTVIHTNLGRAVLAEQAISAVVDAMRGYSALEYDTETGDRGDRDSVVEELILRLTGAEAATVVNNCAAAVLLSLVALGARKEVIISRSEQIEIGGSFRMPDIMKAANCRLVEVGTTNRTHLHDYRDAITDKTALIVKAHRSNYAVTGFTSEVGDEALASLAHAHGLFYMVDLGSGALVDMSRYGLPREPLPSDALSRGADCVMFSGDKLLGGPQAGIIVGSAKAIAKIKKHPLKRSLRVSKIVLAALEATLRLYDADHELAAHLPVLAMLSRSRDDIRKACERVRGAFGEFAGDGYVVDVIDCASQIGSGALPEERLPSAGVRLQPAPGRRSSGKELSETLARFRRLAVPVIGRIKDDAIIFDCRCLLPRDEQMLSELLK